MKDKTFYKTIVLLAVFFAFCFWQTTWNIFSSDIEAHHAQVLLVVFFDLTVAAVFIIRSIENAQ